MPMKNPPHPGDFIRAEIIEVVGLTVTAAAVALHVSRPALSSLLNSRASLSGDMALRIRSYPNSLPNASWVFEATDRL